MLLNNQQITKEIKICIEMNENENTITQNLWTFPLALLLLNPIGFGLSCFHSFLCIFWFIFLISSVICWLFRSMLFSLHMFLFLIVFFSCSWHLILPHCDQKRCLRWFQFFLNLPRLDSWSRMWSILQKVPCALEKKANLIVLERNVL